MTSISSLQLTKYLIKLFYCVRHRTANGAWLDSNLDCKIFNYLDSINFNSKWTIQTTLNPKRELLIHLPLDSHNHHLKWFIFKITSIWFIKYLHVLLMHSCTKHNTLILIHIIQSIPHSWHTTGFVTSGTWTACPSGVPEFTPGY